MSVSERGPQMTKRVLIIEDETLHWFDGYRHALFPTQGGHAPELERRDTLTRLGQTLARIHTVGARTPFRHRIAIG